MENKTQPEKHARNAPLNMTLSEQIVKYRYAILAVFIALLVLACALLPSMIEKVNYDFTSYLPDGYATHDGYEFLSDTFGIHGDIEIGIHCADENAKEQIAAAVDDITKVDGVSMAAWSGTLDSLTDDTLGLYDLTDTNDKAKFDELTSLFTDGENWLILATIIYAPSSQDALNTFAAVEDVLSTHFGENFVTAGMTSESSDLFTSTINEIWKYILIAVAFVIVILAFTTNSAVEPLVLLLSIGISVLLNMGTNAVFPSTSIITFTCSAILQLGLTMDYAIFLLHQYRIELKTAPDAKQAMVAAIPKSAKSIFASALTTIGGLLALMVMKFEIGPDLGMAVAKGIVLSLFTVLLLQPCLMLMFDKARIKTTHKCLDFHYRSAIKGSIKNRWIVALVFLPVFAFSLLVNVPNMPFSLNYTYVHFQEKSQPTEQMKTASDMAISMGNQVMITVPCYSIEKDDGGSKSVDEVYIDQQYAFIAKLNQLKEADEVSFFISLFSMLPDGKNTSFNFQGVTVGLETAISIIGENGDALPQEAQMVKSYVSNGYTMYTVGINTKYDVESKESFAILDDIRASADEIFGECEMESGVKAPVYMTGYSQGAYDFAAVTPTDFTWVTVISVLVIFVILLFSLASLKYSLLLVALIECGIWINLLMQWIFSGGTINFMSYMIISAVQLGATVDYAILITTRFRSLRKRFASRQAAYAATTQSAMAITTSAAILATACASLAAVSSNLIVQELCFLIARGAVISALLVLFVLPALLVTIDSRNGNELYIERTPNLRRWHRKPRTAQSK